MKIDAPGLRHALSIALAFFLMAFQQPPASTDNQEIVISGLRLPSLPVIDRFVRNAAQPIGGQIAAFRQPVCPEVLGLEAADAAKVIARMYVVGKSAGVRMVAQPCSPNFSVIIAADGRAFMAEVRRKRFQALETLTAGQRSELLSSPGPAWAWRTVATHTVDGMGNMPSDPALGGGTGAEGGGGAAGLTGMPVRSSSLFKLQVRQDVGDAYVVFDEKALDGISAIQVADYAMMRGVAGARPSRGSAGAGSILSLFEPEATAPRSMNYLDLAFLRTLYELPMELPYLQQMSVIASRINRAKTSREAAKSLRDLDEANN